MNANLRLIPAKDALLPNEPRGSLAVVNSDDVALAVGHLEIPVIYAPSDGAIPVPVEATAVFVKDRDLV